MAEDLGHPAENAEQKLLDPQVVAALGMAATRDLRPGEAGRMSNTADTVDLARAMNFQFDATSQGLEFVGNEPTGGRHGHRSLTVGLASKHGAGSVSVGPAMDHDGTRRLSGYKAVYVDPARRNKAA